jgi:two-component system invasion response regulator UvrY
MTEILLADDHITIRKGLKVFIEEQIPRCNIDEAHDGDTALKKIKEKDYGLIILDVNMPETDSFSLVNNILAYKPSANILMFSMNPEELYGKKYLQLGAKGYLNKASPEEEIKKAVELVIKGRRYLGPVLTQILADDALGKKTENPFNNLSRREFEIAMHMISGKSMSEICNILSLQPSTVSTHKAKIFEKLQCNNIIDINTMARLYNILPGP